MAGARATDATAVAGSANAVKCQAVILWTLPGQKLLTARAVCDWGAATLQANYEVRLEVPR
jgi:hypothetical protein